MDPSLTRVTIPDRTGPGGGETAAKLLLPRSSHLVPNFGPTPSDANLGNFFPHLGFAANFPRLWSVNGCLLALTE